MSTFPLPLLPLVHTGAAGRLEQTNNIGKLKLFILYKSILNKCKQSWEKYMISVFEYVCDIAIYIESKK